MKGYVNESDEAIVDDPKTLEDKVVVFYDEDSEKWKVSRTTVVEEVTRTTTRRVSRKGFASFVEARDEAKSDHELPVYVPSDDRARAELEQNPPAPEPEVEAAPEADIEDEEL